MRNIDKHHVMNTFFQSGVLSKNTQLPNRSTMESITIHHANSERYVQTEYIGLVGFMNGFIYSLWCIASQSHCGTLEMSITTTSYRKFHRFMNGLTTTSATPPSNVEYEHPESTREQKIATNMALIGRRSVALSLFTGVILNLDCIFPESYGISLSLL